MKAVTGTPVTSMPAPAATAMEQHASEAAAMLRLLASERRLVVLCTLIAEGESPVGRLAERAGLSQPAMSQHLAKLREDGLVATRRAGTTVYYRIADDRIAAMLKLLTQLHLPLAA